MTPEQRTAIEAVVQYNWSDELADFIEQDDDGQEHHIFKSLQVLVRMLGPGPSVTDEVIAALEGDSNDAEHDALVSVATALGLTWRDDDEETYSCQNCGHQESDPPMARDLDQRIDDPDDEEKFTDRECSRCGALTYKEVARG